MRRSNCGCPYCKGEHVPDSRGGWKGRRNNKGFMFGNTRDATKCGKKYPNRPRKV